MPFRPEPKPAWAPSRREPPACDDPPGKSAPKFHPRLLASSDLGAVRINFRYASFQSMAAADSEKAGRDQYFEGPHETYGFRLHEIDPSCLDLQYQPISLEWSLPSGKTNRITFDYGIETQDGRIIFGEDKPTQDYFLEPKLAERLNFAEAFLHERGASLERRVAGGMRNPLARRVVKDIFDARRTEFKDNTAERVQAHIWKEGGTSRLDTVLEVIGGHSVVALEIARAMMHRRILLMPMNLPAMPDTPVTVPPPAEKGALRAFLSRYVAN